MKIIIAYASAGIGHRQAAAALHNYFNENYKHAKVITVDALDKTNRLFKHTYRRGYLFMVHHCLWLWAAGFWLTYAQRLRPLTRPFTFALHLLNSGNFIRFLIQENPDCIISTHFLPSQISAYYKRKCSSHCKIITVITDFGVHPFWIAEGTDLYFAASDFTKKEVIRNGVSEVRVKVSGIPVDLKFLQRMERLKVCEKLGIDKDKFTVLLITGSFGIGPIEKITDLLCRDAQVLAVCANNKRLLLKLKSRDYPNTKVFGFVHNVEELMSASDMLITKPGGLTISEALNMELVPVFISPIPGQETFNAMVLRRAGIGFNPKNIGEIKDIVLDFKNHPQKLQNLKEIIRKIKPSFAAKEICDAVCKSSLGPCG